MLKKAINMIFTSGYSCLNRVKNSNCTFHSKRKYNKKAIYFNKFKELLLNNVNSRTKKYESTQKHSK
jgi:hypothetical protein